MENIIIEFLCSLCKTEIYNMSCIPLLSIIWKNILRNLPLTGNLEKLRTGKSLHNALRIRIKYFLNIANSNRECFILKIY